MSIAAVAFGFIIIPVVEMVILIEVGSRIGALPTVALVLLTLFAPGGIAGELRKRWFRGLP